MINLIEIKFGSIDDEDLLKKLSESVIDCSIFARESNISEKRFSELYQYVYDVVLETNAEGEKMGRLFNLDWFLGMNGLEIEIILAAFIFRRITEISRELIRGNLDGK